MGVCVYNFNVQTVDVETLTIYHHKVLCTVAANISWRWRSKVCTTSVYPESISFTGTLAVHNTTISCKDFKQFNT